MTDAAHLGGDASGPAPSPTLGGRAGPRHANPNLDPLGPAWVTVTVVIGVMAALIALGGMVLSFHAVSVEMVPAFGARWAWLVPIVVDLTVFVFSGVDLVLARLDMGHPLARWTVYGATFGTVWLNYAAGGNLAGRIAHVLMPSIWVVFIELMRHVVRRQVNLATASHREPVPAARWLLSPWPTLRLWRRMVLWRINSYPRALDAERIRLTRIAQQRDLYGPLWRLKVDALTRLSINLGESATPVVELSPLTRITPAPADTHQPDDTPPAHDTPRPTPPADDTLDTPSRDTRTMPPTDTASVTHPAEQPQHTASARDTSHDTVPLRRIDFDADLDVLTKAEPPEWRTLSKADAVRRFEDLLPGRTGSQVARLLTAKGVAVDAVYVRTVRSRARRTAAGPEVDSSDTETRKGA